MTQRRGRSVKKGILNFFGSLGYLVCFLQWFWALMLYFSVIQSLAIFLTPSASDKHVAQAPSFTFTPPSSLEIIILVTVVIVMIALTLYALIKIPIGIAKSSNKVVHKTAESLAPLVIKVQHKEDTKKSRLKLTAKLMFFIKLVLIIIPLVLTLASRLLDEQSVSYSIAITIGYGLAGLCVAFFGIQYLLASWLHISKADLW